MYWKSLRHFTNFIHLNVKKSLSQSGFKINRLNPPIASRAGDGLVVRCWTEEMGNPVSQSSNPACAFSFKVEEIGSRRSFCQRLQNCI